MTNRLKDAFTRPLVLPVGLIAVVAVIAALVMYGRWQRAAHLNRVTADTVVAYAQDMTEERKDLPRFLPLAREAITLQRRALASDPAALSGVLMLYGTMSGFSHFAIFSTPEPPVPVVEFERGVFNELADTVLALIARADERGLAFVGILGDNSVCDELRDKCDRLLLDGEKLALQRISAGNKQLTKLAGELASKLNSKAWEAVSVANRAQDVYVGARNQIEIAALADPADAGIQNTLALAQYRAGQLEPASQSIVRAVDLRKDKTPEPYDLAVGGLIHAKSGRTDQARAALQALEARRARAVAEAAGRGQKANLDDTLTGLMDEIRALVK